MDRPDWWRPALIAGCCLFIPMVGPMIPFGWQKRCFEAAKAGQPLPDVDFMLDLTAGLKIFIGLFISIFGMIMGLMLGCGLPIGLIAGGLGASGEDDAAGVVALVGGGLGYLLFFVVILGFNLVVPDLLRREFKGELVPAFSPGATFRALRAAPGAYGMVLVGLFLTQFVAQFGIILCFVGVIFTATWAYAVIAHLLAQFDTIADAAGANS